MGKFGRHIKAHKGAYGIFSGIIVVAVASLLQNTGVYNFQPILDIFNVKLSELTILFKNITGAASITATSGLLGYKIAKPIIKANALAKDNLQERINLLETRKMRKQDETNIINDKLANQINEQNKLKTEEIELIKVKIIKSNELLKYLNKEDNQEIGG